MLRFPEFSWDKIKKSSKPVLIYGMGNGADKVIDELHRLEIPILGVTASDAFVRGQQFRGPHLDWRQEPQASSPFLTPTAGSLQGWDRRVCIRPRISLKRERWYSYSCVS